MNKLLIALLMSLSLIVTACSDTSSDDSDSDDSTKTEETADSDKKEGEEDELDENGEIKKKKQAVPVEVVSVARGDIQQTYRTITTLEAENDAEVVARSTGVLEKIFVEEGDHVKKGQLLAQLDVELLSLEVAQLAATSKKLNKELDRQKSLFKRKLTSSDALDRARFEFQSQDAQYKISKLKLNYASIRAPINGMIIERHVKAGNLIKNNEPLFKIVDPASLVAVMFLPEKEIANIKKNQTILLAVDALNGSIITGTVDRIRPSIDITTGTFKVVAKLNNPDQLLQNGMFGKVEVVFDMHFNSLLLEQQAVITQDNRSHVFVVRDNKAMQTPVKIGFKHNNIVEITEGLLENDQVITTGQQILKHETKIEIVGLEEPQVADKKEEEKIKGGDMPSSVVSNP
ncbi:MAG: membrane fusion protein (multidrug efflux system) [Polaribacter sp.]|jgi:membrane fusion protein (multidrug efflux system)